MKNTNQAGFSLIELMVVISIMAILAVVVISKFGSVTDDAKLQKAKMQISEYANAIMRYKLITGSYPTTSEGLEALEEKPASAKKWMECATVVNDPWGNPYIYEYDSINRSFDITSYGADGTPGGTEYNADIKYSERKDWDNK